MESINLPKKVKIIGRGAFRGCKSLKEINLKGVTTILDSAFSGCISLTNITIPDSVTTICSDAFEHCTSLTSITIPDSVTTINTDAFRCCARLKTIITPKGSYAAKYFKLLGTALGKDFTITEI